MTPLIFRRKVLAFYKRQGRSFPWRTTTDPYAILVSEVMLQQTQTHRVVPKYIAFLRAFPTPRKLAAAPLAAVLQKWQGLGYNRRALMLQRAMQEVVRSHGGALPRSYDELLALPGIGPYTAGAVLVFAFNHPQLLVETNIRAAVIHEFFPVSPDDTSRAAATALISDKEVQSILAKAMPTRDPRTFYQALMDYGSFLKQKFKNPSRRSLHHVKQSTFEGSTRQLRGGVIRLCLAQPQTLPMLVRALRSSTSRLRPVLVALAREGMLEKKGSVYQPKNSS
jgi:A/G-specific adenine glycosylase